MDRRVIADTDALIDFVARQGAHAQVRRLASAGRLATTAVSAFELWRGCESDSDREGMRRALRGIPVYPLNDAAARRAAELWRELATNRIGERDTLIAGIALAVGLPLLTSNVKHFQRVPGLRVELAQR